MPDAPVPTSLQTIVALSKARGFVFPGSEIYGGLANTWEYGPMGVELKRNIMELWWKRFVHERQDMVGLDSSIILHPRTWKASGHVDNFADAMVDCKSCNTRTRADHLIEKFFESKGDPRKVEGKTVEELQAIVEEQKIPCPQCKERDWTPVRKFNQLFETSIGIIVGEGSKAYLRGETAQGIFLAFKNIVDSSRVRLPFGVGQMGKSFRNEITMGNFIHRTLEFEQAEIEYFFDPEKTEWEPLYEDWKRRMFDFVVNDLGTNPEHLRWRPHEDEERSFYSKRTEDLEYQFPYGFEELWGLAYRTDYDLTQHETFSGKDLTITDPDTQAKIRPHVIEPAVGVNRLMLLTMLEAYREEGEGDKRRVVLGLKPKLAPYKAAVFPLLKNKPPLVERARKLADELRRDYPIAWDERGNIGKRYYSQDEIGTPLCITVDFQTLDDDTVTIRDRDTMQQERVPASEVHARIAEMLRS